VYDPAQADSVTECGSTWPKMAFVSHPRLVITARWRLQRRRETHPGGSAVCRRGARPPRLQAAAIRASLAVRHCAVAISPYVWAIAQRISISQVFRHIHKWSPITHFDGPCPSEWIKENPPAQQIALQCIKSPHGVAEGWGR